MLYADETTKTTTETTTTYAIRTVFAETGEVFSQGGPVDPVSLPMIRAQIDRLAMDDVPGRFRYQIVQIDKTCTRTETLLPDEEAS